MPPPPYSRDDAMRDVALLNEAISEGHTPPGEMSRAGKKSAICAAAERAGMNRVTFQNRIRKAKDLHGLEPVSAAPKPKAEAITLPVFADDDIPAEDILRHMASRFGKAKAAADSRKWFTIKINEPGPIGIAWFGDPHLGSNGCNVPLLMRDVQICRDTPGMFGANIGDTVDNWGGRLTRLYAENDVSRKTERKLAKWFLQESGVRWALWLHGNHDSMDSAFAVYLDAIGAKTVPMIDWRAQFKNAFPCKTEFKIDAAHNHKGHSMWNELHGQIRASVMEEDADLYVAGHHHNWSYQVREMVDGRVVNLMRVRGYKFLDSHAGRWQFPEQQLGSAMVTIFDPQAESPAERVKVFPCIKAGAAHLTYLRKARASRKRAA